MEKIEINYCLYYNLKLFILFIIVKKMKIKCINIYLFKINILNYINFKKGRLIYFFCFNIFF